MRRAPQLLLLLSMVFVPAMAAQDVIAASPVTGAPANTAPPALGSPKITFIYDFDPADPPHYELTMDTTGQARYRSEDQVTRQPGEWKSFAISAATRDRIFNLARDARYFQGNFDYRKSRIAFTGNKTLTYDSGSEHHSTTVNWSENASITALVALFQGISSTLEGGDRLRYKRRYDRLGLNAYLAILEKQADNGWLKELRLIKAVLEEIVQDRGAMDLAKRRAQHLLDLAEQGR